MIDAGGWAGDETALEGMLPMRSVLLRDAVPVPVISSPSMFVGFRPVSLVSRALLFKTCNCG